MKFIKQRREWCRVYPNRKANSQRLSENQDKPRNSTNNVSFAELMRMLKGE